MHVRGCISMDTTQSVSCEPHLCARTTQLVDAPLVSLALSLVTQQRHGMAWATAPMFAPTGPAKHLNKHHQPEAQRIVALRVSRRPGSIRQLQRKDPAPPPRQRWRKRGIEAIETWPCDVVCVCFCLKQCFLMLTTAKHATEKPSKAKGRIYPKQQPCSRSNLTSDPMKRNLVPRSPM
jgi:hypothetical protein